MNTVIMYKLQISAVLWWKSDSRFFICIYLLMCDKKV